MLIRRGAAELGGDLAQGRVGRDRHLRVCGRGINAHLELGICRGGPQRLMAFPVGGIDRLEPGLRRKGAVQPGIQEAGLGGHQRGTLAALRDEHGKVFGRTLKTLISVAGELVAGWLSWFMRKASD